MSIFKIVQLEASQILSRGAAENKRSAFKAPVCLTKVTVHVGPGWMAENTGCHRTIDQYTKPNGPT